MHQNEHTKAHTHSTLATPPVLCACSYTSTDMSVLVCAGALMHETHACDCMFLWSQALTHVPAFCTVATVPGCGLMHTLMLRMRRPRMRQYCIYMYMYVHTHTHAKTMSKTGDDTCKMCTRGSDACACAQASDHVHEYCTRTLICQDTHANIHTHMSTYPAYMISTCSPPMHIHHCWHGSSKVLAYMPA